MDYENLFRTRACPSCPQYTKCNLELTIGKDFDDLVEVRNSEYSTTLKCNYSTKENKVIARYEKPEPPREISRYQDHDYGSPVCPHCGNDDNETLREEAIQECDGPSDDEQFEAEVEGECSSCGGGIKAELVAHVSVDYDFRTRDSIVYPNECESHRWIKIKNSVVESECFQCIECKGLSTKEFIGEYVHVEPGEIDMHAEYSFNKPAKK